MASLCCGHCIRCASDSVLSWQELQVADWDGSILWKMLPFGRSWWVNLDTNFLSVKRSF